ncbi:MAG TPA: hypothetical protein VI451_13080 [Anaerolineales bacterium]|nr:hypothetical protein [Anaerolineales bacterium]
MTNAAPTTQFLCTQCGGELHPDQGQLFITCPFCNSTVYLDKSQVVFHWYLAPTMDEPKARTFLTRWMAGNDTVKDLDKKAKLAGVTFEYFPMWYFKRRDAGGNEQIWLQPAAATSISELKRLKLPAGDLRNYDHQADADARQPTVPLQAAQAWMLTQGVRPQEVAESALVHLPVFNYKYAFNGQQYTALVEAATGKTLANIFPAKDETPYLSIAGLTLVTFLILAAIPVFATLGWNEEGLGIGLAICVGSGILAAGVFFALAAWVAAKV